VQYSRRNYKYIHVCNCLITYLLQLSERQSIYGRISELSIQTQSHLFCLAKCRSGRIILCQNRVFIMLQSVTDNCSDDWALKLCFVSVKNPVSKISAPHLVRVQLQDTWICNPVENCYLPIVSILYDVCCQDASESRSVKICFKNTRSGWLQLVGLLSCCVKQSTIERGMTSFCCRRSSRILCRTAFACFARRLISALSVTSAVQATETGL